MSRCAPCRRIRLSLVLATGLAAASGAVAAAPQAEPPTEKGTRQAAVELLGRLPLLFVPEQVSADGDMGFVVRGRGANIWLTDRGMAYQLRSTRADGPSAPKGSWVVSLDLVGATPRRPVGENPLPTRVSYFKGPRERWRTGLPTYGSVRYREPWPGVDVVLSGAAEGLRLSFVVRAGADPGAVHLAYRGASALRLESDGSLVAETLLGDLRVDEPSAHQDVDGHRVEVAVTVELEPGSEPGSETWRVRVGDYDRTQELLVDPVTLLYSGFIGGASDEEAFGIAVDAAGNAYVTGWTTSSEATFPITVGPDLTYNMGSTYGDAFVAKINAAGTGLDYCGYIGGSQNEQGFGIAVDASGNAYVRGVTNSSEASFPVTVGPDLTYSGSNDHFVAKINAAGTDLDYCGYIGGAQMEDTGGAIAVDSAGCAYVTGRTYSTEATFPVTVGPDLTYSGGDGEAYVAKVNPAGTALDYCGYIGGSGADDGSGIAVDSAGNAFVVGSTKSTEATFPVLIGPDLSYNGEWDAFVAKANASGTALDFCGYIGGSNDDVGNDIAVDSAGDAYVAGGTRSDESTFPVSVGPDLTFYSAEYTGDAFVAKVEAAGAALDYCGYIGGWDRDSGYGIAVDSVGNAYVVGPTRSRDYFPVTVGPDLTYNGGTFYGDGFIARVNAGGTALDYCGYIGGGSDDRAFDVAVDSIRNAYVAGGTEGFYSFPVTVGPDLTWNGGTDAFVANVSSFDLLVDGFESGDTSAWSATVP